MLPRDSGISELKVKMLLSEFRCSDPPPRPAKRASALHLLHREGDATPASRGEKGGLPVFSVVEACIRASSER